MNQTSGLKLEVVILKRKTSISAQGIKSLFQASKARQVISTRLSMLAHQAYLVLERNNARKVSLVRNTESSCHRINRRKPLGYFKDREGGNIIDGRRSHFIQTVAHLLKLSNFWLRYRCPQSVLKAPYQTVCCIQQVTCELKGISNSNSSRLQLLIADVFKLLLPKLSFSRLTFIVLPGSDSNRSEDRNNRANRLHPRSPLRRVQAKVQPEPYKARYKHQQGEECPKPWAFQPSDGGCHFGIIA